MKNLFKKRMKNSKTGSLKNIEVEDQDKREIPDIDLKQGEKEFESFFSEVLKRLPEKVQKLYLVLMINQESKLKKL